MSLFSKKQTARLEVKGMHCEKCVARVTEALEGVSGVTGATVSLEDESAVVEGRDFETEGLTAAVEAAGFNASVAELS